MGKGISAARQRRSLRRRAGFRRHRHRYPDCRLLLRQSCGSARSKSLTELNSCGSARSRSPTELNSCGLVRNKFAVPSTSVRAAGCKSAAANCHGCCCRPGCHVASAAADRKSPRCSKGVDCRRPACFRSCAGAARKSGRCCSKRLGGCRCSLASKALRPVRWRLRTANRRVPTADDSRCSCPLLA